MLIAAVSAPLFAEGAQETKKEEGKVTLHFFQFKPYLDEPYAELAAEFEKEYPNITVDIETLGGGTVWQDILKSKFAAGEGPDIFPVEGTSQYELWSEYIADITGEAMLKNALPLAKEALNIDGRQMGMPVNLEGYGYIYNKDIFAEVGITELPKTLDELEKAAQKIKAAGYTPFATGYATWWVTGLHLVNVAFAQQDDPLAFIDKLNAGTAKMADNQYFQDLQNIVDLTVKYGEKNPLTTDHNMQIQLFANGKAAMIQQGVWKEVPIYEANPEANIGLLPVPLNNNAEKMDRIAVGVPFYYVINKKSAEAEQDAARKFLDFHVNTEIGQRYLTEEFGFIPALKGVSSKGLGGVGQTILEYSDQDKVMPWVFGYFPDGFGNEVTNLIQAYVAGRHDWDTVLSSMDSAWQKLK